MSRIVDEESGMSEIKTGPASQAYKDGWERIFGSEADPGPPAYACTECCDTGAVMDPDVDPETVETEGDLLKNCPSCNP